MKKITSVTMTHKKLAFNENAAKKKIDHKIDHSMSLLVISYWGHKNSGTDLCDHMHQARLVQTPLPAGHFIFVYNFA